MTALPASKAKLAFLFTIALFCFSFAFSQNQKIYSDISEMPAYKDSATQYLFNSLQGLTRSGFTMFGVANGLTINYKRGPKHAFNDKSDCKDITGSHPAFIESDFMWYDDITFMRNDTTAMREAYKRGIITGYCWHLRGKHSNDFYAFKNNVPTADKNLVKEIVADTNRLSNASLDWYLGLLDNLVIPVFKGLGFPLVFRPFHEMTGGWFWWGNATCTAEEYVALWKITVDYLRSNGVKNVLYAWAPDKSSDMATYPGNDYVDVIGYDGYDIGIASYHSTNFYVANYGKLSQFALENNKIAAITETGHGKYPESHPDYWLEHVLLPAKKNVKARNAAWVMSWYNADWSNNNTGVAWIPYSGIEKRTNGQEAIDKFIEFYEHPQTMFAGDMPNLYYTTDTSFFIYPNLTKLVVGDSLKLMGGSKNNWFAETPVWKSMNEEVATVDQTGMVHAVKAGTVEIEAFSANGYSSVKCTIVVVEPQTIGIEAIKQNNTFRIFPNPVLGESFYIAFDEENHSKKTLEIFNSAGQKVAGTFTYNNQFLFDARQFKAGVYCARAVTANNASALLFVIK